nr:aminotransferase class I/II-fold pyridoxal phosphate-dependent enzyme [Novosphingobium flavum]
MTDRTISRRTAFKGAAAAAAGLPLIARAGSAMALPAPADTAAGMIASLHDRIYINANENPHGPCLAATKALAALPTLSGRYGMSFGDRIAALFAAQNGLKPENVVAHPGSYVPLRAACLAFSSTEKPIAYAEPTFDSGFRGADGKPLTAAITLPVGPDHSPDVKALLAAAPTAGVYYLCNPNNPTGTVTSREDILWLLANKPKGSILLVDEAYIHYSTARSCVDLVAQGADVLVLRTFSKIYGLAGLRIGFVCGRPTCSPRLTALPTTSCRCPPPSQPKPACSIPPSSPPARPRPTGSRTGSTAGSTPARSSTSSRRAIS